MENIINNNNLYNQVLTMTVIPLLTSAFTSIFTNIINDLKILIISTIKNIFNKIVLIFYKEQSIKFIVEYDYDKIIAILWYINKTKSITDGKIFKFNILTNNNKNIILCPNNLNINNNNNDDNNNSNINDNNNIIKINDNKNLYYKTDTNSISIIMYNKSILDIENEIHNIILEYEKFDYENNKNKIVENSIALQLYSDGYESVSLSVSYISRNIIPIIWYLNHYNKITNGLIIKNGYDSDLTKNLMIPFIKNTVFNDSENENNKNENNKNNKNENNKNEIYEVKDEIYYEFKQETHIFNNKPYIRFFSKKSSNDINNLLKEINKEYAKEISKITMKQRLYTYKNEINNESKNNKKFNESSLDETQTFDHLFFDQKQEIMDELNLFENKEYYKKFGMKRKIIYLLYGKPGTGKTSIGTSIANYKKRSIKYISFKNLETNDDLDFVLDQGLKIERNKCIELFDEIDKTKNSVFDDNTKNNKNIENDKIPENIVLSNIDILDKTHNLNNKNKLDIGYFLSKIDGNEDQDGIIMVATCNDISKFDFTMYRNGRFKLIEIKYVGRKQITEMIEKYGEVKLSLDKINTIRDDRIIQTLTIKELITQYIFNAHRQINDNDIDILINKINELQVIDKDI